MTTLPSYAFKIPDGSWLELDNDAWTIVPGLGDPDANGTRGPLRVPPGWAAGLTADERERRELVAITEPGPTPDGQRIASSTIEDIEGVPVRVATYEDIPPPPLPAEVPMYKVEPLLIQMGLLSQVEAALEALTGVEGEVARSKWRRAPNLVRADPLVQGMAAQLGFDLDALILAADALP